MWVGHLRENSSMYKRIPSRDSSNMDDVEENLGMHRLFEHMEYVSAFLFVKYLT